MQIFRVAQNVVYIARVLAQPIVVTSKFAPEPNGLGSWNFSAGGYGGSVNREAPADYDGDGRADISVRSDTGQNWVIDYAWNGFGTWNASFAGYGGADSIPVPADYDGDGRADLSIKTSDGRWLIDYASNGFGAFD